MSKKIYIKRTKPFIHEHMNSEVMDEQMSYTKRSIGSYYESKTSTNSGSGLNPTEKKLLLPLILGVDIGPDFFKKVNDFYIEIDTKIPYGKKGLELEIGLQDDTKSLSMENLPLNIEEYIRYRHALGHPNVAASPEQAEGVPLNLIWFFVEDPTLVVKRKINAIDLLDRAMVDYQQIKSDPQKVKMIVTIMKNMIKKRAGFPVPNVDTMSADDQLLALRELATEQAERFHQYANDQNLKKAYFIDRLLTASILSKIGNAIVDNDSNEKLGDSIKEVITNLWDGKNSSKLTGYKQKLEESNRTVMLD